MCKRSFYISTLIVYASAIAWIMIALCFNGRIPYFCCPLKSLIDIPCPLCGLTQSCLLLLQGDIWMALRTNLLIALSPIGLFLPFVLFDIIMKKEICFRYFTLMVKNKNIKAMVLIGVLFVWIINIINY